MKRRFAILVVTLVTCTLVALTFGTPIPARGAGEPVPPLRTRLGESRSPTAMNTG
ncbi:MAG: hypothetical protein M3092_03500 [Actinomycetia bacterium]|nr:hypothetical protein [Actinomycetes bacterium]